MGWASGLRLGLQLGAGKLGRDTRPHKAGPTWRETYQIFMFVCPQINPRSLDLHVEMWLKIFSYTNAALVWLVSLSRSLYVAPKLRLRIRLAIPHPGPIQTERKQAIQLFRANRAEFCTSGGELFYRGKLTVFRWNCECVCARNHYANEREMDYFMIVRIMSIASFAMLL